MILSFYKIKLFLISPNSLQMPDHFKLHLKECSIPFIETENFEEAAKELDILYVTRIQKERFPDPIEYEKVAGCYKITLDSLKLMNKQTKIMHPLPRVDEIDSRVDETENAIYFKQAHNGIPVRQALLSLVTGVI
jgi:aspartate carbamoyltransferase catalytic subunit